MKSRTNDLLIFLGIFLASLSKLGVSAAIECPKVEANQFISPTFCVEDNGIITEYNSDINPVNPSSISCKSTFVVIRTNYELAHDPSQQKGVSENGDSIGVECQLMLLEASEDGILRKSCCGEQEIKAEEGGKEKIGEGVQDYWLEEELLFEGEMHEAQQKVLADPVLEDEEMHLFVEHELMGEESGIEDDFVSSENEDVEEDGEDFYDEFDEMDDEMGDELDSELESDSDYEADSELEGENA